MAGWARSWVVVVACAPWACGNPNGNAAKSDAPGVSGAGGTSDRGRPPGDSGAAGVAGAVSAAGTAGMPAVPPAVVDPAVSATYSWAECGRIEPSSRPTAGLYTPDESIVKVEENGRVLLYPNGASVAVTLVPARPGQRGDTRALLSPDGRWLLAVGTSGELAIYAAPDGGPLGASTESVNLVTRWDVEALADCPDAARFSSDSSLLLTRGAEHLCVVDPETGALRAKIPLGPGAEASDVTLLAGAAAPVRVLRGGKLWHFSLDGTASFEVDVRATWVSSVGEGRLWQATFTPDAERLLVSYLPDDPSSSGVLVAIDSETGAELWRQLLAAGLEGFTVAPDSSVVQVHHGGTFRIRDGQPLGTEPPSVFSGVVALGPGGRRELRLDELLMDWDLRSGKLLRLYGSHTSSVRDLDITRDGRFLASHGRRAAVWELEDDFAQSVPLYNGAAPDDSWNVALSVDGSSLAVSGDNVAFFQRDGSFSRLTVPEGASAACLSADWSFSPLGAWAAGTHYGNEVFVYRTPALAEQKLLPTRNCGGGVAFSPDGSKVATASLELFDTATWKRLWTTPPRGRGGLGEDAVQFSPDGSELLVTACPTPRGEGDVCSSARYSTASGAWLDEVPGLTAARARYSPEGHWVVSGNDLVHVPTGRLISDAFPPGESLFAANGDIIAGDSSGALVRYCRSSQ